jgi:hypothetical protein
MTRAPRSYPPGVLQRRLPTEANAPFRPQFGPFWLEAGGLERRILPLSKPLGLIARCRGLTRLTVVHRDNPLGHLLLSWSQQLFLATSIAGDRISGEGVGRDVTRLTGSLRRGLRKD